ncbi:MAG: hypothetical protein U5J63_13900 [Fodinibius sp.]|nr:hypothetical protein [Fodinibius sp.]
MKNISKLVAIVLVTGTAFLGFAQHQQEQPETQPLIPMMRMLLADMQTVDQGIFTENYELIAKGAAGIADHPKMTQKDKRIIKKTLGKEIKQFVAFDMTVHHHADSMRMAALEEKMQEVLRHYRIVQQGCVDCHSNYRTRVSKARKTDK